jgi:non-ribosomal peptide synthetase component F
MLTGWLALLSRLSGQTDLVIGVPVANRRRPEAEGLIGFLANTLPLRVPLDGRASFVELLGRVRQAALGAYDHQDLPFDRLVAELAPDREAAAMPLLQTLFAWQPAQPAPTDLPGLRVGRVRLGSSLARFDVALSMRAVGAGADGVLEYRSALWDAATMRHWWGCYRRLLRTATVLPNRPIDDMPLLGRAGLARRLAAADGGPPVGGGLGHEPFVEWARRTPDAIALVVGGRKWTYDDLGRRAAELAGRLRGAGVGPEARVGLCLPPSADAVVAILAVLKAGGAYVFLDTSVPPERLWHILADARPALVLTARRWHSLLGDFPGPTLWLDDPGSWDGNGSKLPAMPLRPDNLAYVI